MPLHFLHWTFKWNCPSKHGHCYLNNFMAVSFCAGASDIVDLPSLTFHTCLLSLRDFLHPSKIKHHRMCIFYLHVIQTHTATLSTISLSEMSRKHLIALACQIRMILSCLCKGKTEGGYLKYILINILFIYESIFYVHPMVWCNPFYSVSYQGCGLDLGLIKCF